MSIVMKGMDNLRAGFRFYPTEEELLSFYLLNKLYGQMEGLIEAIERVIPVVDIYEFDPPDLPRVYENLCHLKDSEQWFFFIPRQELTCRGGKPSRTTATGYWKATGTPGTVYSDKGSIGDKRTMVFYNGKAPNGKKTEWKMNEYHLAAQDESSSSSVSLRTVNVPNKFSLCRVYVKAKLQRSFDRRPLEPVKVQPPLTLDALPSYEIKQDSNVFEEDIDPMVYLFFGNDEMEVQTTDRLLENA